MRAVVETLRVPGAECADLINEPSIMAARGRLPLFLMHRFRRCDMAEPVGFMDAFAHEQCDVLEEELSAIAQRDLARCSACGEVRGLRENPWITQDAAANQHTLNARLHPVDHVSRLDAVAAAEHRDRQR